MKERIKFIRGDMSMQSFADRIGVSKATISLWESGSRNVPPQMIKAISKEFHVNEDWLRTGSGKPYIEMTVDDEIAAWVSSVLKDREESTQKRILRILSQLDATDWKALDALLAKACALLNGQD